MEGKLALRFLFTLRLNKNSLVFDWSVPLISPHARGFQICVRHIQLKPIRGCSRVQLLRHKKAQQAFRQESPLVHKPTYLVCKEFHRRLRKLLCHSLLHVIVWREFKDFHNGREDMKSTWYCSRPIVDKYVEGITLLHDSARLVVTTKFRTRRLARYVQCQTPCISPWDFQIFRSLKKALSGCTFSSYEDMQKTAV
jgi:phage terminase large subunit-like protein